MTANHDKCSSPGRFTRAAILAMALTEMMSLEAANIMLSNTDPQAPPFTREEFTAAARVAAAPSPLSPTQPGLTADTRAQASKKGKSPSIPVSKLLSFTIVSIYILDNGSIVAILENADTGTRLKMIDQKGDFVFDKVTTIDDRPLKVKPKDLNITNLDEVLDNLRRQEPPEDIYGGPNMMDLYD